MKRGEATIYQVAERAGVSISTVSMTFNRPERVGANTRQKVVDAAGELGYRPHATPAERASASTRRIAVVAPFQSYPSYRTRLMGVLAELDESGIDVTVHNVPSAASSDAPLLDALPVRGDVDGVLVMGVPLSEAVGRRLAEWGPATVLVDTAAEGFSVVAFDDDDAGYLGGRHLVERGHRHIMYVHEEQRSDSYLSQGQRRIAGLQRALGDDVRLSMHPLPESSLAAARAALPAIMAGDAPPTALFAHHDQLAAGLLAGARDLGIDVPGKLAVLGIDDDPPLAEALGLSTIRQPLAESGRIAAEALLSLIERPTQPRRTTLLHGQLVVRDTT